MEPRFGQRRFAPIAVMVEEVEMTPGVVGEVMGLADAPAGRAGIERAALSLHAEVEPARNHVDVKT